MLAYLGSKGALVGFKCPSAVDISKPRQVSYKRTLGGRVKAQYGPTVRREWQVGIETSTPAEVAALQGLSGFMFGPPPWVWIDPWAQVTNLLTPEQSMPGVSNPGTWFGDVVAGGAVTIPGLGRITESLVGAGPVTFPYYGGAHDRIPVVPGQPLTVAVYGSGTGTGTVTVGLFDANGAGINTYSTNYSIDGTMRRYKHTMASVPNGAATAYIRATGFATVALPSATWTKDLADWSPGNGCRSAIVEGLSESVQLAVREVAGLRRSGLSFTVKEVG